MHQKVRLVAIATCAALFIAGSGASAALPILRPSGPQSVAPKAPVQAMRARFAQPAGYFVATGLLVALGFAIANPTAPPGGTNIWSCKPSAQHPYPVVLVTATFADMEDDFGALGPILTNAGYCVFSLNYGDEPGELIQAVGPVVQSAQQVAAFVARVLAATGTSKVDMVGHSQGGMLAEYYAKLLGGAANLHDIVALAPTTHGTSLDGLALLAQVIPGANQLVRHACPACRNQEIGSTVIKALDNGPIAQPGVNYTIVETQNEFVVTPVGSSFINEQGVTNEWVQAQCPLDLVDHIDLVYDQVVIQEVLNALDPATAQPPACWKAFPFPA